MKEGKAGCSDTCADRPDIVANEAGILAEEVAAILSSPALRRAPILSRLLHYLLERTLAGKADRLKAYTVAVDGLARAADFDAQLDSYPRVQVVRLRKAFESYYLENPSHTGPCVFLGSGSYRLRLGERAIAYPALARLDDVQRPFATVAQPMASPPRSNWHMSAWRLWTGLAISILIVGLMGLGITASREAATARLISTGLPPGPMHAPVAALSLGDGVSSPHVRAAAGIMSDGLRRSWVARIRDETTGTTGIASPSAYRIMLRAADAKRVDIELIDTRSGTILWTGSDGRASDGDLVERLAPAIAMISGPFGIIARVETARLRDASTGSYACILRYFAFMKARSPEDKARVAACVEQPVDDPRFESTISAVRAFFTLESRVWPDRGAQLAAAELYARRAAQHNADDPYVQFAMARLAYMQARCPAGRSHSDRAVAANPYDSVIVTVLAGLAAQCDHPRGRELLDRAYRIRNDNEAAMRGFLVLSTLEQGQDERLTELDYMLRPPPGPQLGGYLLTESLIAAAQGRGLEATARWSEFRKLYPGAGPSDDEKLKMIILSDPMRRRVLTLLREKGVISS